MTEVRRFILDTDWLTDVDDAVAARYLIRKHLAGEIVLLGANVNTFFPSSAPSIDSFFAGEGLRLPIGIDHEATGYPKLLPYHKTALRHGGGSLRKKSEDYPDSVAFYRGLLSSLQEGEQCEIISIGFFNSLARLMESSGDDVSPLSGAELIRLKVKKLWAMAGNYPEGKEYNISFTKRSIQSAQTVCESRYTPITFLGYECGKSVISGGTVKKELGRNDLLYRCLRAHGSFFGRCSWDPMTAFLAVSGSAEKAGFSEVFGKNTILPNGRNLFIPSKDGLHSYVKKLFPDEYYKNCIDSVIAKKLR